MPPYRNPVEARSSGIATQYVSDSHDHKPDAPGAPIKDGPELFYGISLEVAEIVNATANLVATVKDIEDCFNARQQVSLKVFADSAARLAWSISIMSSHVAKIIAQHSLRRVSHE